MTPDRRIARAARRANARALEKFVADGAEGANVPRELRVVKRATTALFLALGLDLDRSMFLRGEFVADALRGGGSPRAFLETSKSMMTTFRLVVGLRDATRLMTRENDGRGALAVCEAACGDQTLASVVLVLLRSYAERYGGDAAADDYARNPSSVVKLLTGNAASSKRPLVVVENSGAALDELRPAAPSAHFVSFTDDEVDASKGKGHAEHRAIRRALPVLERCRRIVKITGRYFVEGLDAVLDGMDADVVVQSTQSPWSLGDGVLRSEVVGFDASLLDALLGGQDESRGRPAERALFEGVQKLERAGRSAGSGRREQPGGVCV